MKHDQTESWAAILGLVLLNLVLNTGCSEKVQEFPGTGPVEQFRKQAQWISVYSKHGVARDALYATELLSPFAPGHPLSEAVQLFGEPKTRVPEERSARYIIYETAHGVIKLGSETDGDGYTAFPMYFVPNDRRPAAFFCAEIVKQLDSSAPEQVVLLYDAGHKLSFLHATIEYGQIQTVVLRDPKALELAERVAR